MEDSSSYWMGKRVLITGAGGFIGSHLTERLVNEGAKVRAFIHYNALGRCGWLDDSRAWDEIEVMVGDVVDRDCVLAACDGIDTVFHLAALIGIPYSYHAPLSYVRTNVEGTLNVLQAARAAHVERIVHTSTSEVYGSAQYVPIDEGHPLQGQSPYSASKIGADKMAEAFHRSFELPVVTVRPFNTFGPRQSARAVIPTIITQCLDAKRIELGSLHPTRDMVYVADTVDGFLRAARIDAAIGRVINLGTGVEISIGELAEEIAGIVGMGIAIATDKARVRPAGSEVDRLCADNRLARDILEWAPSISRLDGLQKTVEWFAAHGGGAGGYAI